MIERALEFDDDDDDESSCCRWSLKPSIFGWVNAHFSHRDVSQSRQKVYGGLLAKQQNDEGRSLVDRRVNDGVELVGESSDEKAEC